jgi:peptidoglycan/LPS O-acetylase OafA/YrhL
VSADLAPEVARSVPATLRASAASHLSGLDLARGLAAIAVVLFHFTNNGWLPKEHWLANLGWYGHLGVRAFFVMSGFVVPFAMWRGGYTGQHFFSFIARRLARLYPPYAVSVCIMGVAALFVGTPVSLASLAAHAFYLNDLVGMPWLMEVYWTLAVEVQFYLLIALIWRVVAVGRSGPFVLLAIATIAATLLPWPERSLPNYGTYFLLGVAAFRWHGEIGSRAINGAVVALAVLAIWRENEFHSACAAMLPLALLALPITVPRWGRFLGDVSYSLYLFHMVTGAALLTGLGMLPLSADLRVPLVFVALAISLAGAALAFRWIEAPAMKLAKRFAYRPGLKPRRITIEAGIPVATDAPV